MNTETYPCVGIDVSKHTLDVCCLFEDTHHASHRFTNDRDGLKQLRTWLRKQKIAPAKVCLEATSHYSMLATCFFYDAGWEVYLINPAVSHAALGGTHRRTKTDKADALDLARYLEGHYRQLHPFAPLAPEYQQLRWLVRELANVTTSIADVKIRMEQVEYMSGVAQREIRKKLTRDLKHHEQQKQQLLKQVHQLMETYPDLARRFKLVQTVPGIGPTTAMQYMAEIPDLKRFTNKRQVAAHAGLTPRVRHSGTHQPISQPISKVGSKRLRSALYMASLTAGRFNPVLRTVDLNLKMNGKPPIVAKVAVARRLVEMLFSIEKHNRPFDPNYMAKKSIPVGAI